MTDTTLIKLVNPEFTIEFMGKEYTMRKATLDKSVQYKERIKNEPDINDAQLIAVCLYIMLKDKITDLTEQIVMENTPANIDAIDILEKMGFINPSLKEKNQKEKTQEKQ